MKGSLGHVDKLLMSQLSAHFGQNFVSSPRNISILLGSEPIILTQNDLDFSRSAFCPRGLRKYW